MTRQQGQHPPLAVPAPSRQLDHEKTEEITSVRQLQKIRPGLIKRAMHALMPALRSQGSISSGQAVRRISRVVEEELLAVKAQSGEERAEAEQGEDQHNWARVQQGAEQRERLSTELVRALLLRGHLIRTPQASPRDSKPEEVSLGKIPEQWDRGGSGKRYTSADDDAREPVFLRPALVIKAQTALELLRAAGGVDAAREKELSRGEVVGRIHAALRPYWTDNVDVTMVTRELMRTRQLLVPQTEEADAEEMLGLQDAQDRRAEQLQQTAENQKPEGQRQMTLRRSGAYLPQKYTLGRIDKNVLTSREGAQEQTVTGAVKFRRRAGK